MENDMGIVFTEEQSKRVIARMRSSIFGIPLKQRGGAFNNCFVGFEGVDWLVKDCAISRKESTSYSQHLMSQGVIECIWPEGETQYLDEDEAYYILKAPKDSSIAETPVATILASEQSVAAPKKVKTLVAALENLSMVDVKQQVQKQLFGLDEEVLLVIRCVLLKGPRPAGMDASSGGGVKGAKATSGGNNAASSLPSPAAPSKKTPAQRELLCMTLKANNQRLHLHRIQYSSGTYSILEAWAVEDIKSLNFVENSDTGFLMGLDALYKWNADVSTERNEFLWALFQFCQQYLKRIPQTSIELLELKLLLEGDGVKGLVSTDESRFITEEEEQQIEELLKSRTVQDLEILADELGRELVKMESRNINELIQEHFAIKEIWEGLKGASERVQDLVDFNRQYQDRLDAIAIYFEQIEQKNNRMAVITRNQQKLLDELQKLMDTISLGSKTTRCLERGTFEKGENLDAAVQAAAELRNLLHHNLPPGLVDMKAVHQQMEIYLKLRGQFARRMRAFLNATFKNAAENTLANKNRALQFIDLSKITYQQLQPFQPLVSWLKEMEDTLRLRPEQFKSYKIDPDELCGRSPGDTPSSPNDYLIHLSQVWRKEISSFYTYIRKLILRERSPKLSFKMNWDLMDQVTFGLAKRPKKGKGNTSTYMTADTLTTADWDDDDDPPSEMDDFEGEESGDGSKRTSTAGGSGGIAGAVGYGKVKKEDQMPVVKACMFGLKSMLPLILAEQGFLRNFFQFSETPGSASGSPVASMTTAPQLGPGGTVLSGISSASSAVASTITGAPGAVFGSIAPSGFLGASVSNAQHVQTADILAVLTNQSELDLFMERLIETWPSHINTVIERAYKMDRYNCIPLWVQTHLLEQEYKSSSSYITTICAQVKSTTKNLFDRYVSEQVGYITETKFASVKAVGLLSHTTTYIQFVDRVEASGGQQGSSFVEPAYAKLSSSLFQWLNELGESEETRLAVRYENFRFIHTQLAARKIANLQTWCDRSKILYEESLQGYVQLLIGKRFHAVMDFFDGVDKLYKTVPAENIQFQHTHSNQVIGKLLQKFKLDVVEEGLWKEFRRIKRDITSDPGYSLDVWKTLKNYFLGKIKHFQTIVQECYRQQKFPFTPLDIEVKYRQIEEKWEAKISKKKGRSSPSSAGSTSSSKPAKDSQTSSKLSQTDDVSDDAITEFDDISELDTSD
jgi:hypothetical protein